MTRGKVFYESCLPKYMFHMENQNMDIMGFQSNRNHSLTTNRWESLDTIFVIQSLFKGTVIDFDDIDMNLRGEPYANDYEKD